MEHAPVIEAEQLDVGGMYGIPEDAPPDVDTPLFDALPPPLDDVVPPVAGATEEPALPEYEYPWLPEYEPAEYSELPEYEPFAPDDCAAAASCSALASASAFSFAVLKSFTAFTAFVIACSSLALMALSRVWRVFSSFTLPLVSLSSFVASARGAPVDGLVDVQAACGAGQVGGVGAVPLCFRYAAAGVSAASLDWSGA